MSTTPDPEDFLEHFGVKGMKWGKKKSVSPQAASGAARAKQNRADGIQAARDKYKDTARPNYLAAKKQFKADNKAAKDELTVAKEKYTNGKRAAEKAFNKVKDDNFNTYVEGNQYKNGKEVAKDVLTTVGLTAVGFAALGIAGAAAKR